MFFVEGGVTMNKQDKNKKSREELTKMLAINKPNQATVIKKGKTNDLFQDLIKNRPTEDYWKECANASKKVDSLIMDKIKKMCTGEK